jgi:hypothetical protein
MRGRAGGVATVAVGCAALWLVVIAVAGCGGHASGSSRAAVRKTGRLEGRPQIGVLSLRRGAASASYTVTALSPPRHTYDVQIMAPAQVVVAVRIHTWYGVDLGVDTTHDPQWCKVNGGESTCSLLFPKLEAQRAGPWRVIASKRSGPAATVRVSITFSTEG